MRPPKPQILTTDLPVGRFHREHGTASHRQTKIAVTCLKPAREGFVAAERISPRSCQSGYGTLASFCRKLRTSLLPCGGPHIKASCIRTSSSNWNGRCAAKQRAIRPSCALVEIGRAQV